MTEIWKAICGCDGYEVSNLGQVRSVDRTVTTKNGHRRRYRGKTLGQATDDHGYKHVCLWKANRQVGFLVHRLVAATFLRHMRPGEEVNHGDFDKNNNTLDNFEIISRAGNMAHSCEGGRMAKKLNSAQVYEIKYSILWGEHQKSAADRFVVTPPNINAIVSGKIWKRINLADLAAHD